MTPKSKTERALLAENAELRARLEEAEETLRAIRNGELDAIIVGEQVYMLERAGTSSNRFRGEVLAQINDAVIAMDNDLRVTYLNPAAERQYGVTTTEALGRQLNELLEYRWLSPEDEAAAFAAIEATGSWRGENIHVTRDGKELHVELVINRLGDESGAPIGLLAVIRDISERQRAEAARAQLVAIVESSADAIYSCDFNGRILSWNKSAEKLYGWTAEEIIGQPISIIVPPDHTNEWLDKFVSVIKQGQAAVNLETVRRRRDGSCFEVWLTASPIKDAAEKTNAISIVARDITERRQAEEALRASQARIAADLSAMTRLYEVGNLCVREGNDFDQCMKSILEAAISFTGADKGNIQLFDAESGSLVITAQRGFEEPFLKFFARVHDHSSAACGMALRSGERVVVKDVTQSEIFAGHPSLDVLLEAGVRAVQSTLLVSSAGKLLGIISTHFGLPHRLGGHELRLLDLLARQAGDFLERKQAEVAQAYHTAIVESADDAIISKTLQGIITSWNRGAEKLFGYTAAEIIGQPINVLIPPDRQEEEVEILARLRRGESIDHFETVRLKKDGTALDISITVSPIKDRSGRIIGASKFARDISERKQFEESLRRSERKFRDLLEKLPAAAYTCDAEGLITYYNRRAVEMWGREPKLNDPDDRFCGSFKLYSTEGTPLTHDQCWMALTLKEDKDYNGQEIVVERSDGSRHPGLAHVNPIHDESGKLLGAVNVVVDISDRKRAEMEREELLMREKAARAEAQAANRSKDEFLSLVSHELRSPLNSILGYNRILRSNPHDKEMINHSCNVIERNARTQLRLIEDLLDTARIVSGKLRLDLTPTDIVPVLVEALDEVRPAAEARGIELRTHYDTNPEMINGDSIRLQQVIGNLLSNAIKFTPDGGRIELWLKRNEEDLCIVISDTGKGIAPEFLPHIFDRFREADSSSSRRHGGLGLGLALVKHLVELHGGTVEAASEGIGLGSTFTVRLPLAWQTEPYEVEPPALLTEEANPLPEPATIEGLHVLAVDDQQEARELLATFLSKYGAVVTTVSSGVEALEILTDTPDVERPDVLICDIAMPEEDGYAFMERVRALEKERRVNISQRIPAIALTSMTGRENWARALSAGFNTHVAKPADPAELVMKIVHLVKDWSESTQFK